MARKDPRFDAYIAKSAPFARPILQHLRKIVHTGCPQVEETWKWSFPHFDYKGMMCSMAGFKEHCAFGFWKAALILGADQKAEREAMGHFGRITSLADLPADKVLVSYVRRAVELNDAGVKAPARSTPQKKTGKSLQLPDDFSAALEKNKKAQTSFEALSPSHRKEYVEWVTGAKRAATRKSRLATTIEWLAEGKVLNWRYQPKKAAR
ncbi:MAG: YdeI/OmpD-associated family protein [Candidatus Binatia bacterium]